MPQLKLFTYWRSSASHRVRIALAFKGLAYEPVFVNLLKNEQRDDSYKKTNPTGYVPSLVVDGSTYTESTAIIEWLEERFPNPPLLPNTPEDRARVRALVQIINSGIQPLQNLIVLDKISAEQEARAAWVRYFMPRGLAAYEALASRFAAERGSKGPFSYGDAFTMADAFLIPQIGAARRFAVDLSPYPTIERVEQTTKDLPFVLAARPEAQPDAKP
jgi:maleylacetoacetate isomerase